MSVVEGFLPKYTPAPVPLEGVLGVWTAARTFGGGLSAAGGQIILTRQYLVFTPWDMTKTRKWLFELLAKAGAPSYVGKIDDLITKSKLLDPVAIPLTEILGTQVLNRASIFKAPGARLSLRNGSTFDVGILASERSPDINPANNDAFDDWLAGMHSALAGVRAPQTPGAAATVAPPDASEIVSLLPGSWRIEGSSPDDWFHGATLDVRPNGEFTGRFVMFGGMPEGCATTGTWFFVMGMPDIVAFQGKAVEPRLDAEVLVPFAVPIQLIVEVEDATPDKIVGRAQSLDDRVQGNGQSLELVRTS